MIKWPFENPRRMNAILIGAVAVILVGLVITMTWRTEAALDRMESRSTPTASPTGVDLSGPLPDERYATTPTAPVPTSALANPDESAFPNAGDPTPIVLSAVDTWRRWDFDVLGKYMLPGVLEEATANPPARDMKVTGVARVSEPGPTQSVVDVPTNKGVLAVTTVVVDGEWKVESLGWKE